MKTELSNNKKKILINGDFLSRRLTGIERFAHEITIRLDRIISKDEIAIVIPDHVEKFPDYRNLEIVRLKKKSKSNIRWQMITLQWFLLKHKNYTILDFGNTCLPLAPGIVFLHDIYCKMYPEDFKTGREKFERFYFRFLYRIIAYRAKQIITVSNFSKNQIITAYHVNPDRITVIYNGWEHYRTIESNYGIFKEYPVLLQPFFFFLGSLSKRKNLKWIIEYAAKNSSTLFAVAGESLNTVKVDGLFDTPSSNIILLGYLDDGKIKALMEKCKAFILPSYYEGFGIPPLEALSCGARIIVSNAASLPEIYGNKANYINPYNTDIDLDKLIEKPVEPPDEILKKYSHDVSAQILYNLIKNAKKNIN